MWQAQPAPSSPRSASLFAWALPALCLLAVLGCSGEPFEQRGQAPAPSGELPTRPRPGLAAAVRGTRELVVFEPANGRVRSSRELEGPIVDLSWHAPSGRLLVVVASEKLDATRAHAFTRGLVQLETSPPFGPEARVLALEGGALLVSNEIGASWTPLDESLTPLAQSQLVAKPDSLAEAQPPGGWHAVALSSALDPAGQDVDRIIDARFGQSWQLESTLWPAPARPVARIVARSSREDGLLVRKWGDVPRFALAELGTVRSRSAPRFARRAAPGADGELEEVAWDAEQRAVLALLVRASGTAMLACIGVEPGAQSSSLELEGKAELGVWLGKRLARVSPRELLVATSSGLSLLVASGTPAEPAYGATPKRVLPDLGAPVVALDH